MQFPLPPGDYKNMLPRFQKENLEFNLQKVEWLKSFAAQRNLTASQVALAWLLNQGDDIIPVVGMNKPKRIIDNIRALEVELSESDLKTLDENFKPGALKGERYPERLLQWIAS